MRTLTVYTHRLMLHMLRHIADEHSYIFLLHSMRFVQPSIVQECVDDADKIANVVCLHKPPTAFVTENEIMFVWLRSV